jgi:hypothetical protein
VTNRLRRNTYFANVQISKPLQPAYGGRNHMEPSLGTRHHDKAKVAYAALVAALRLEFHGRLHGPASAATVADPRTL